MHSSFGGVHDSGGCGSDITLGESILTLLHKRPYSLVFPGFAMSTDIIRPLHLSPRCVCTRTVLTPVISTSRGEGGVILGGLISWIEVQ
jgi:hypothetical protein